MALRKYPVVTVSGVLVQVEAVKNKTTGETFKSQLIIETPGGGLIRIDADERTLSNAAADALVGQQVELSAQIGVRQYQRTDGTRGATLEAELAEVPAVVGAAA